MNFNPHLPQEMTHYNRLRHDKSTDFNPHLPQEMTLAKFFVQINVVFYFNPHLPQEMTPYQTNVRKTIVKFQSTSPAGDDSANASKEINRKVISIHISRRR